MNYSRVKLTKVGRTIRKADIEDIERMLKDGSLVFQLPKIGSGCFGKVYKYTSSITGKQFAIKISSKYFDGATVRNAYDIETLLQLREFRYIPKIHAYDNVNLGENFVMIVDYIDGVDLCDFNYDINLDNRFVKVFNKTIKLIVSKNISVNDLHGHNIMIDRRNGLPVIVDFGGLYKQQNGIVTAKSCQYLCDRIENVFNSYKRYQYERSLRQAV